MNATPAQLQSRLVALQLQLSAVQSQVSTNPNDPCSGLGPPSAAGALQNIGDAACTLCHDAALTALGYASICQAAAPHYANAENATVGACDARYTAPLNGDAYGTITLSGSSSATCLDPYFLRAVQTQVSAAATAVNEAAAAQKACAMQTLKPKLPPQVVMVRPGNLRFTGDDTSTAATQGSIAAGAAGGAATGALVGVLIGLIADAPWGGALVGAIVGGAAGGFVARGNASS